MAGKAEIIYISSSSDTSSTISGTTDTSSTISGTTSEDSDSEEIENYRCGEVERVPPQNRKFMQFPIPLTIARALAKKHYYISAIWTPVIQGGTMVILKNYIEERCRLKLLQDVNDLILSFRETTHISLAPFEKLLYYTLNQTHYRTVVNNGVIL